ncbi:MAG: (4Fe-4S)-binding protein [Desulfobulbus propionicus]|nr:MAG: (4Fe-4S)-binding protein [Desulfobulbus propionicus]
MIISVASGKGGTGKTTVATNMALALETPLTFLDCDVEAPNANLFLQTDIDSTRQVGTPVPFVQEEGCTQCRKCMDICRFNAIAVVAENVLVFSELCHSCGGCMLVCPENIITETDRELGNLEYGTCGLIRFVHGKMRIGEAMAPPLIKRVREEEDHEGLTIIDAPPGTSCPVIAAIDGVDFVLMVTEPTPFGLHDLKLAVEAVNFMGLPCGLVINRAGLGNSEVYSYAKKQDIPILLEIPFDRKIAETYSLGHSIIDTFPEWKKKFQQLYADIVSIVQQKGKVDDRVEQCVK